MERTRKEVESAFDAAEHQVRRAQEQARTTTGADRHHWLRVEQYATGQMIAYAAVIGWMETEEQECISR